METNIFGRPKYRDKKGNEYPSIESFKNKTSLPEIEIKESQRNKKEIHYLPGRKKENLIKNNKLELPKKQRGGRGKRGSSRSKTST